MRTILALLAAALWAASCGGGGGGGGGEPRPVAEFQPLGLLGAGSTTPTAVSADGSVVVGDAAGTGSSVQAFRWTASGGLAGLGTSPQGTRSSAAGVAADGAVVVGGGDTDSAAPAAFRWTIPGTLQVLPLLEGTVLCSATGVSGDGATVVGSCGGNRPNAGFRWTAGSGMVSLGQYGGGTSAQSTASAISRDGSTIVGFGNPYLTGAMLWTANGTAVVLGKLLVDDSSAGAVAVSRDGAVVVGTSVSSGDTARMFRWTSGAGMQALQPAPATGPGHRASGMSGDGSRVVGWIRSADGESDEALVWTQARGTRALAAMLREDYGLELSGWRLLRATAISDDGSTIVGAGRNPQGQTEGWRIALPR